MPVTWCIIAIAPTGGMGIVTVDVREYYCVDIEVKDVLHEGLLPAMNENTVAPWKEDALTLMENEYIGHCVAK